MMLAAAMAASSGCVQQPGTNQSTRVTVDHSNGSLAPSEKGEFPDIDSCAGRLHDIEGELLEYYRRHQKLPPALQDLRPIAQAFGDEGNYTCPVSGQTYIYVPNGMVIQGDDRRLILYDAVPAHEVAVQAPGQMPHVEKARWGLLFGDAYGNRPPSAWVIKIPESLLQHYRPAPVPPPASQPAPAASGAPSQDR